MAAPATVSVFTIIRDSTGAALANQPVSCFLNGGMITVAATGDSITDVQQATTTDGNGRAAFTVVPNDLLNPANTTYTIREPGRSYDIAPQLANGPIQQTTAANVIVSSPATLAPATSNVTGPLTVSGGLTVSSGGLAVTGGLTTDTLTLPAGGFTMAGPLTLTTAASRIIPGATSFAVRDTTNANDNLLISNAGAATIRNGLTVTAGGLTVSAGASSIAADLTLGTRLLLSTATSKIVPGATALQIRDNADANTNFGLTNAGAATIRAGLTVTASGVTVTAGGLTVSAGGAAITGTSSVTGNLTHTTAYKARAYRNAAVSHTSSGTYQKVTLDTKVYDLNTNFDTSTGLYTAPVTGYYEITGGVQLAANANREGGMFSKNGGAAPSLGYVLTVGQVGASGIAIPLPASIALLTAGDTVGLYGFQESGGSLAYSVGADSQTWMAVHYLSS